MPTGYTAAIEDGCTFKEYAMGCARAFGACVMMRDESSGKEIPEEFKPSSYHSEELAKAEAEVARLEALTDEAAKDEESQERAEEQTRRDEYRADCRLKDQRYQVIREQVVAWKPPFQGEHDKFKEFMLSQIDMCFPTGLPEDYHPPLVEQTGAEWKADAIAKAHKDVGYHKAENAGEIERAAGRTKWVQQLRNALMDV